MSKEAMKLALEALGCIESPLHVRELTKVGAAIAAIKEALAQPEQDWEAVAADQAMSIALLRAEQPAQQEPVATLWQHGETGRTRITMPDDIKDCDARWFKAADLYTSPPAQRTWVGLTDEEKSDIWCVVTNRDFVTEETHVYADAIEAKLKEKNT